MPPPRRQVAIYARISQDRGGEGLGVQRQLVDCRAEAERRGWTVAEEYVDDDVSAYGGKSRPAYARLLADLRAGDRDAVIVWHIDRLHRRPIELEEFVNACQAAGVNDVVTLTGDLNLGNGDGLLVARLLAAVAAGESDAKSRRSRRKMQELAEAGKPHGGGTRSFGFNDDRLTLREAEAAVIRQLASRALAGETLTSLTRWLQDSGVRTVGGGEWRTTTVRGLLINPRIAGLRPRYGEAVGRAVWPGIISVEDHERLKLLLTDPARRTNRSARRYLLSGMAICGKCGTKMVSGIRDNHPRYLCRSGPDFGGCGRTTISGRPVEEFIAQSVLYRLDSRELEAALTGRAGDDEEAARLGDALRADDAQLAELADLYAQRQISSLEWMAARRPIDARRADTRRRIARLSGSAALDGFVGNGSALRASWSDLGLARQVAIVKALVDHVVIETGKPSRTVDLDRVRIMWRR